mgnify:CR=1 FL=1
MQAADLCERQCEETTEMLVAYPYEYLEKFEIEELLEPDYFNKLKKTMTELIENEQIMKKVSIHFTS